MMLYAAVRCAIFVGLLLLIGCQTAALLVRRTLPDSHALAQAFQRDQQKAVRALLVGLLSLIFAKGLVQLLSFVDADQAATWTLTQSVLLTGKWGTSWLVQLAAVFVLLLTISRVSRVMTALLTLVIIVAQTGMGHAAGSQWPGPLGRVLDTLHLSGLGIWLGTLTALAITAFPRLRGDEQLVDLARVVRNFSLYARVGVLCVIASGVIAALVYVGPIATIAQSTWGKLLLIKLGCMAGVMALGWYNWRVVTPALAAGNPDCRIRLRLAVRAELALGFVMLVITAFLVSSALPGEG